jgi:hypothetical protein
MDTSYKTETETEKEKTRIRKENVPAKKNIGGKMSKTKLWGVHPRNRIELSNSSLKASLDQ